MTLPPLHQITWQVAAPGVWRSLVGKRVALTLLSAAEATPDLEALARRSVSKAPPIELSKTSGEIVDNYVVARVPLSSDKKLYGLGLQMHDANRRGGVYHLRQMTKSGLHVNLWENPYTDQYLLGDDLLVAPMFVGAKSRTVRLPRGAWFDYETGVLAGENETIEISPALDRIPLYVCAMHDSLLGNLYTFHFG